MTLENGQQKMTSGSHLLYRWLQLCSMNIENPLDFYFRKITAAVVWRRGKKLSVFFFVVVGETRILLIGESKKDGSSHRVEKRGCL